MSIFDEEPRKKPTSHEVGSDLSMLSVDELEQRINLLKAEIERLEKEKESKQSSRDAADSIFR